MALVGSAGPGWRLGRRPALDGLRGIAVALVVLSHVGPDRLVSAGQVGVTVFFGLSGFLISTLLLEELDGSGRVRLAEFYRRRAARLLPALYVVVAACVLATLVTGVAWVSTTEVLGAVLYCSNLLQAVVGGRGHEIAVLHHTWSLVIEEQFYLVWPAAMLLLRRHRRWLLGISLSSGVVCLLARVLVWDRTHDHDHVAYGIDTRIDGILLGCALALLLTGRPAPAATSRWGLWLGGVVLALSFAVPNSAAFLTLGPTLVSVATLGVLASIIGGGAPRWLAVPPLVWLGQRSYGLYLWHHPIAVMCHYYGLDGWSCAAVMIPLSLLLTVLSWRYVEQPVLRRRHRRRPASSASAPRALTGVGT